jgi:replicative DNA helicase
VTAGTIPGLAPGEHVIRSEMAVTGAACESARAAEVIGDIVRPEHFRKPAHGLILEAALALAERGDPVDPASVLGELTRAGNLRGSGGAPYLHDCLAAATTAHDPRWHAAQVRRDWDRRHAGEGLERALQYIQSDAYDPAEGLERVRQIVEAATAPAQADGPKDIGDLFDEVLESLEKQEERGLPLPWGDVGECIAGLARGELITLAGSTGTGKSLAGLNICAHLALRKDVPVLISTMEMTAGELMLRLISAEARIPLVSLVKRRMDDEHWVRVESVRARISSSPLVIDDTPGQSVAHIRSRVRGMARTRPAGLVFVDYIQQLTDPPGAASRQEAVSKNSRDLKLLAGEFGIPVLAAAQLNRMPARREGRHPELSDLRESGAIENDSSVVILLYRDKEPDDPGRAGEIDFIVAKNRSGPLATITLGFQGEYARCVDLAPAYFQENR